MDSQRELKSNSLNRQGSLYSLTLDEVQTHLAGSGKALGSMNLDELLKSVCSVEANQQQQQQQEDLSLSRQGSLTLPRDLSKKTVEEVWKDIQHNNTNGSNAQERRDNNKQATLGDMTLEDLLLKAGVVTETVTGGGGGLGENNIPQAAGPWVQYHQLPSMMPQGQSFMPYPPVGDMQGAMVSQSSLLMGGDTQTTPGRKRVASGEVVEKTVERKQKRMIKNRESAARSRARKQAYTQELEIKVSRLEAENERLRRQKEVEKILPSAPPPDPKRQQLRRTSSAPF
ncbi:ABSCISIC ACID-INSENSITIVE 5-like protein 2 [Raphanus sativus]|uniref:ABSCISIC ACID-INSENSITIVE 5-like protein 2 isoform X2 n=1 Tax=Raphanus sativus TaxID=3726 RepID=A0A6J0LFE9_RAPSA|nr:ABSCISIC ACID-INSENSITIVE 5-like protein 2 isoform X2 [Raphanus sativus]KAJ4905095.1 ABSCISIC ACID-INSENSITIVE 5-like protein 2 [Raphanus sativus]